MKSILILSPSLQAVSGVSTHANMLFGSSLAGRFRLCHYQVGSEGRRESLWWRGLRTLTSPWRLLWFLAAQRPDIVHINSSLEPKSFWRDVCYLLMARALRRRIVSQIHGGDLPQSFFPPGGLRSAILRRFLDWSDAVVVLSQEELESYRRFSARARVTRIANAVTLEGVPERSGAVDASRPLRLLFVGRLARDKGVFEILHALPLLQAQGMSVELQIAGSGPEEAALKALVAQRGLERLVRFPGPVFGADKARLWEWSDVFVFPTYHKEGLPYALLEAMAAGVPPITCPVAAIPDVMIDGVHGLFVPPKDPAALAAAIGRLGADRAALARMSAACRQRIVEQYSVARLEREFTSLYESL
jgi:glycosyltransferase involved in cell wall biosynthesis